MPPLTHYLAMHTTALGAPLSMGVGGDDSMGVGNDDSMSILDHRTIIPMCVGSTAPVAIRRHGQLSMATSQVGVGGSTAVAQLEGTEFHAGLVVVVATVVARVESPRTTTAALEIHIVKLQIHAAIIDIRT
jgi:hypothetical protein